MVGLYSRNIVCTVFAISLQLLVERLYKCPLHPVKVMYSESNRKFSVCTCLSDVGAGCPHHEIERVKIRDTASLEDLLPITPLRFVTLNSWTIAPFVMGMVDLSEKLWQVSHEARSLSSLSLQAPVGLDK